MFRSPLVSHRATGRQEQEGWIGTPFLAAKASQGKASQAPRHVLWGTHTQESAYDGFGQESSLVNQSGQFRSRSGCLKQGHVWHAHRELSPHTIARPYTTHIWSGHTRGTQPLYPIHPTPQRANAAAWVRLYVRPTQPDPLNPAPSHSLQKGGVGDQRPLSHVPIGSFVLALQPRSLETLGVAHRAPSATGTGREKQGCCV